MKAERYVVVARALPNHHGTFSARELARVCDTLEFVTLFEELFRIVEELDRAGIEYALVGGLAVAVWGAPRATKDIDLLILPEDVERATEAAVRCGFDIRAGPMTFRDGMRLQRVSRADGGAILTIDFIIVDANLEPAWTSRIRIDTMPNHPALNVVSRSALIAMKAAAARPIDIADIEKLRDIDR